MEKKKSHLAIGNSKVAYIISKLANEVSKMKCIKDDDNTVGCNVAAAMAGKILCEAKLTLSSETRLECNTDSKEIYELFIKIGDYMKNKQYYLTGT